jgi:hypothetical protein
MARGRCRGARTSGHYTREAVRQRAEAVETRREARREAEEAVQEAQEDERLRREVEDAEKEAWTDENDENDAYTVPSMGAAMEGAVTAYYNCTLAASECRHQRALRLNAGRLERVLARWTPFSEMCTSTPSKAYLDGFRKKAQP